MKIIHYLKILRPANAAMAAGAVWLGAWISASGIGAARISLLATAAFLSTGFGNVINDILDRETDRISHPDRPLPNGQITVRSALIYAFLLAATALFAALRVAPLFGIATALPLAALVLYALFLKGTPLAGNLLVSLLVAYSLLFGSLGAPGCFHLIIPALLAMLLNLSREIVKDIQDIPGDRAAGIVTTAVLSPFVLKKILFAGSASYALLVYLPFFQGDFGLPYFVIVSAVAVPLHILRLKYIISADWTKHCAKISLLLKIEMLSGLTALAVDHLFVIFNK